MPLFSSRNHGWWPTACLLACVFGVGCQLRPASRHAEIPPPAKDPPPRVKPAEVSVSQPAAEGGDRAILARLEWARSVVPTSADVAEVDVKTPPGNRWRHRGLDELLARPAARRADLRAFLDDEHPVVAANAAIGLARCGDASGAEHLAAMVRAADQPLPLRCAAAEALGTLPAAAALPLLRELADQYGVYEPGASSSYVADLHVELVRGMARHVDAADDPRMLTALRSPSNEARVEALRAWAAGRRGILPVAVADLRAAGDPRVRAAALHALAARRHPQARQFLADALRDADLNVRVTAISALGEQGDGQARAILADVLKDPSDRLRGEAVDALAFAGAKQAVLGAADDTSWRVRVHVARALAAWPDQESAALAMRLLEDASAAVRQEVVAAVRRWPLAQAGPVLLAAMSNTALMTRKTAAEQLAAQWKPAAEFLTEGPSPRRAEVLGRLRERFREEFGSTASESATPLAGDQRQDPPEATSNAASAEAALERFAARDVAERRDAARELADLAKKGPLGQPAITRLATAIVAETDAMIWQSALEAIVADPGEAAARVAYVALGHAVPEIRRRACEFLAAHPAPAHAKMLLPLLRDPSPTVTVAAVRAMGYCGKSNAEAAPILRELLASAHEETRVEIAVALVRLQDASGRTELERLAWSNDPRVRMRVAQCMGELGDATCAATLVRLLDDRRASVSHAALVALPKVTGQELGRSSEGRPAGTIEQIRLWKEWASRPGTARR